MTRSAPAVDGRLPARPRHVPLRTCVGCRTVRTRAELVRVVLPAAGPLAVDPTGRAGGRGAYLCRDRAIACLAEARRRRALQRALRTTTERLDGDALAAALQGSVAVTEVSSSPP